MRRVTAYKVAGPPVAGAAIGLVVVVAVPAAADAAVVVPYDGADDVRAAGSRLVVADHADLVIY